MRRGATANSITIATNSPSIGVATTRAVSTNGAGKALPIAVKGTSRKRSQ